jgi:MoaA/NifB/PqqE/SkfB family radical SAM enzyme/SAM-dependent methyltransferase
MDAKEANLPNYWDKVYQNEIDKGLDQRSDPMGWDIISDRIKEGDEVLDFACGHGLFLSYLLEKKQVNAYGIDISKVALAEAHGRNSNLKLFENLDLLPPTNLFDVITMIASLEHFEKPIEMIRTLRKLLKPDGTLIFTLPINDKPWIEHFRIWQIEDVNQLLNEIGGASTTVYREEIVIPKGYRGFKEHTLICHPDGQPKKQIICFVKFNPAPIQATVNIDKNITFDKTYLPLDIYIESTNMCNASCHMCPNRMMKRQRGIMDWGLFKRIIYKCLEIEGKGLNIFLHNQGEPLLDPMLAQKVSYIKAKLKKSITAFSTNASLLTKEKSEQLIKAGLDYIVISLDAVNRESYSQIREGLNFNNVVNNVNNLIHLKAEMKAPISITLQMVVCEQNKHEVNTFRNLWEGKARVVIKPMHNFLTQNTSYLSKEISENQALPCMQPFMYLIIYWNGDMGLCCWDADKALDLGNICDGPIVEVFNSPKFREIRKAMLELDCKGLSLCSQCSQIYGNDMNLAIFNNRLRIKKNG